MDDFRKEVCEYNLYTTKLEEAKTKISQMTDEQIKKILNLAQDSNSFDTSALNEEDRLVIAEICETEARKAISTLSQSELHLKQQELWDKHVKHCTSRKDNKPLTIYENTLLLLLEDAIRVLGDNTKEAAVSKDEE